MSESEVIEGNKKIALFMGGVYRKSLITLDLDTSRIYLGEDEVMYHVRPMDGKSVIAERYALKYHSSWDWLMPVWAKVMAWGVAEHGVYWAQEITQDIVQISVAKGSKKDPKCAWMVSRTGLKISDVYEVVMQFITWYNTQPNS